MRPRIALVMPVASPSSWPVASLSWGWWDGERPAQKRGGPVYGLGIAKGLKQTFAHLFRTPVTVQFPEEVRPIPAA